MFELLQTDYRGEIGANDLINHVGQMVRVVGMYVCEKTAHTKTIKNAVRQLPRRRGERF
jgi:hypothetical protein